VDFRGEFRNHIPGRLVLRSLGRQDGGPFFLLAETLKSLTASIARARARDRTGLVAGETVCCGFCFWNAVAIVYVAAGDGWGAVAPGR